MSGIQDEALPRDRSFFVIGSTLNSRYRNGTVTSILRCWSYKSFRLIDSPLISSAHIDKTTSQPFLHETSPPTMATTTTTQTATNGKRGGRGGRGGNRGGNRGRGGGNRSAGQAPATKKQEDAAEKTVVPAGIKASAPAEDEEEEAVCWICAEPVKYYAVSSCNHRTCHVCALRLRALYKKKDCTFCKVRSRSSDWSWLF